MSENFEKITSDEKRLDSIAGDLLKHVRLNSSFNYWMAFLTMTLLICGYAYYEQLTNGLVVTGLRDYISWGMYLASFVFFVAASLIGMLIGSVLGLIGFKWVKPITRIAEIIAVAFAAVAGLVIVTDMGRPDRLLNVFIHGRVQSPIVWDLTVVTTYLVLSLLLYLLPLIPDMAIAKGRLHNAPPWLVKIYELLSFNWTHKPEQYKVLLRAIRILMILVVPVAFAIHTVTSWLFAATPRAGWDSTIFGPYFLTGAFVAGTAAVIIAMFFFRNSYKLEKYLTIDHFDKISKLLVLVSIVYLYFNINEFLVPAYKMKKFDAIHLRELFTGHYATMFWLVQIFGLILPIILLLFKKMRRPAPAMWISIFVLVASWFKRYLIVIPTMAHPYLPVQHVPEEFVVYTPTIIETSVTIMTLVMVLMIISVLSKFFPVISIWEMAAEDENEKEELN